MVTACYGVCFLSRQLAKCLVNEVNTSSSGETVLNGRSVPGVRFLTKRFCSQHASETQSFPSSNNKRHSAEKKAAHSNWHSPILTIDYVSSFFHLFVPWKEYFLFGHFALIHNSLPFFIRNRSVYSQQRRMGRFSKKEINRDIYLS